MNRIARRGLCLFAAFFIFPVAPAIAQTPTQNESANLRAGDGAPNGRFSYANDVSGNTTVVGASNACFFSISGAVYIYVRDSTDVWSEQVKLVGPPVDLSIGEFEGCSFGRDVAISGDTVVVGAEESAHVYVRGSSGVWTEQARLVAGDGAENDNFGVSVSIDGNTIVVGASGDVEDGISSGSAYIFVRDSGGAWTEEAKLLASDRAATDRFGSTVEIDGNTVVVGISGGATARDTSRAAYVFERDASGAWSEQAKFAADGGIAVSGDTVFVGDRLDEFAGEFSGAVFVYTRNADGTWSEQAKLVASDRDIPIPFTDRIPRFFGRTIAASGDALVVMNGADDESGGIGVGYIFVRDAGGVWNEQTKLSPSPGQRRDLFGRSPAIQGETVVIGSSDDSIETDMTGVVHVFDLELSRSVGIDIRPFSHRNRVWPGSWRTVPVAILGSDSFDALQVVVPSVAFGPDGARAIGWRTRVGDVNHDGFPDLILRFRIRASGIACGETEASLSGETFDEQTFTGTDSIETVGCH